MLGIGSIIILIGLTLPDIIFWIDKRRKVVKYSRLEWSTNESLYTQRLLHEELGFGPWIGCADAGSIPVTVEKGKLLAVLDIHDPAYPKLKAHASLKTEESGKAEDNQANRGDNATNLHTDASTNEVNQDHGENDKHHVLASAQSPMNTNGIETDGALNNTKTTGHDSNTIRNENASAPGTRDSNLRAKNRPNLGNTSTVKDSDDHEDTKTDVTTNGLGSNVTRVVYEQRPR